MKRILLVLISAALVTTAGAYEWRNIGPDTRLGGRMISAGYIKGKVVLLDRRDYADPAQAEAIRRLQAVWAAYKTKPFVLVGSHHGTSDRKAVAAALEKLGVTYPVYEDVRYAKPDATPEELEALEATWALKRPLVVILDSTCRKKLYSGFDDRAASGVVGSALVAAARPMTPKQLDFLLGWEVKNLPGAAYLRLRELREKVARERRIDPGYGALVTKYASDWASFDGSEDVRRLAKLVDFSRRVKDRDAVGKPSADLSASALEKAVGKYSDLRDSGDPLVVQEAKNALAELKWISASLAK